MEESTVPVVTKEEDIDNKNSKENVKSLDRSPDRASAKSSKNAITSKLKTITGTKSLNKGDFKNRSNLAKNASQRDSSLAPQRKTDSKISTAKKSSSSLTPPAKTKIPAIQKPALTSTKNLVTPKAFAKPNSPPQSLQQKEVFVKKQSELKQKQIERSNSKANISKSQSLQINKLAPKCSQRNFVKLNAGAVQGKRDFKSQSARSSSSRNKRSPSNMSSRSSPCSPENKTNIRKTISAAGDGIDTKKVDKNNNQKQTEFLTNNQQESIAAVNTNDGLNREMKTYLEQWFSSTKNNLKDVDNKSYCYEEQLEFLKSQNILSFIDDSCVTYKENNAEKLKEELEEAKQKIINLEKKYKDLIQEHEEYRLKLERDVSAKAEDNVAERDEDIKEFQEMLKIQEKEINDFKTTVQNLEKEKSSIQTEMDNLKKDLKNCRECLSTTNKKLQDSEEQLKLEKRDTNCQNELIKKLQNELIYQKKLEKDLAEMTKNFEELQIKINQKAQMECEEHLKQISELWKQVSCLETEKQDFQQRNENLELKIEEMAKLKEKLLNSENKLQELQIELDEKAKSLETVPDYSKENQIELEKLRQSEVEKQREIEKLKLELSKTQVNICQLNQQVQHDQQLLEVRSNLINSMQKNEKTHQINIEDLFAQVGEKNNTINELNCELQTKIEEFRNLYTSLSAKQMEVANQEHIIKLLEESNERSQILRVKQEEKIGRLEEELSHLKQTITFYQANMLAANSGGHLMCSAPPNVNYNENFYYYISQRKKKRQIDINVKKYET